MPLGGGAEIFDAPLGVEDQQRVGAVLDQRAEAFFAGAQRRFGVPALTLLGVLGGFAAFGFLGYGFYLVYRKPKVACAEGSYCAKPGSGRTAKIGLWTASILVVVALGFPRLAPLFL